MTLEYTQHVNYIDLIRILFHENTIFSILILLCTLSSIPQKFDFFMTSFTENE